MPDAVGPVTCTFGRAFPRTCVGATLLWILAAGALGGVNLARDVRGCDKGVEMFE